MNVSNLTVSCDIEKGARYSAYGLGTSESSFGQSVNFTFKDGEVRSQRAFIRDQKDGLTLTSEDKRLSAHSEGDFGNETEGEQTVRFVNMNKGVYVVFHAVPTADDAERLMREVLVPGAPEAQWKSSGKAQN